VVLRLLRFHLPLMNSPTARQDLVVVKVPPVPHQAGFGYTLDAVEFARRLSIGHVERLFAVRLLGELTTCIAGCLFLLSLFS
jgi:hypothetical protein